MRARAFWRDRSGLTLVEAMLTMPIFIIVMVSMVECGIAMFQWNQTVKALQIGARLAAVSSPVVTDADLGALTGDWPEGHGAPTPDAVIRVACGPGESACDPVALDRLVTGGDGLCGGFSAGDTLGVCDFAPFIAPQNLRISYTRAGLGYVGRPWGPVVTVRVEAVNLFFDFIVLDAVLGRSLTAIPIPAHPVTITGEDLSDCAGPCV